MRMIESTFAAAPQRDGQVGSRWRRWAADIMMGRGWVSLIPMVLMCGLMIGGSSFVYFLNYTDVAGYHCYAFAFWHGGSNYPTDPSCDRIASYASPLPFHTLPREYPILALIPFTLTLLAPTAWDQVAFAIWMIFLAAGLYMYLGRVGPRGASLMLAACLVFGGWATAASRFDLVPAAFTLFCLVAASRGRFIWAYVFLAIAVMLKFYPIPLLLPLFLAEQRVWPGPLLRWRRLMGVVVCGAICAALFLLSLVVNVQGAISPLSYFADRPIQIESVPASIMWVASFFGHPICTAFQFGSLNVYDRILGGCSTYYGPPPGPLTHLLSPLFFVLLLSGAAWISWLQWRGKISVKQAFLAMLLLIICTGKVFSPQYMIWLAPLVAYVIGLENLALFVGWCVVSLLTTAIYPYLYAGKHNITDVPSVPGFYPAIAFRNLALTIFVVVYLFDLFHLHTRSAGEGATPQHTRDTVLQEDQKIQKAPLLPQGR